MKPRVGHAVSRAGRGLVALAVMLAVVLATTACGGPAGTSDDDGAAVVVAAAASLKAPFDELADAFHESQTEFSVAPIEYDGSAALASRIVAGADVDVMAFANEESLLSVTRAGLVDSSTIFASNTMQIAVAPGNPQGIESLEDLADPALSVILCAPEVPCGAAAEELLDAAGVTLAPVSLETNVTSVVTRVSLGEADAGVVHVTDVLASGGTLEGITPENAGAVVNRYPIALSPRGASSAAARAFVDFVGSAEGQAILTAHGFGTGRR